jgi:hypothetical protein
MNPQLSSAERSNIVSSTPKPREWEPSCGLPTRGLQFGSYTQKKKYNSVGAHKSPFQAFVGAPETINWLRTILNWQSVVSRSKTAVVQFEGEDYEALCAMLQV